MELMSIVLKSPPPPPAFYFGEFFFLGMGEGEGRRAYLPSDVEFVVAHKVRVVALERVEYECLVRLWDLVVGEPTLVRQVHFCRQRARV